MTRLPLFGRIGRLIIDDLLARFASSWNTLAVPALAAGSWFRPQPLRMGRLGKSGVSAARRKARKERNRRRARRA
ncbi:hypothetical protein D9M69_577920 [compost metagenome]